MILKALRRFDWMMFATILALLTLSFLFVYSAGYQTGQGGETSLMKKQMVWAVVGLSCYAAATAFNYRKLQSLHWWIYGGALMALFLVLFVGTSVYGAHRWFKIGGMMVQPSEFAKLSIIFTLAAWMGSPAVDLEQPSSFIKSALIVGVPFLLIILEPDLGTGMVLVPIFVVLLFCAGIPLRPLLVLLGAGGLFLVTVVVWLRFFPDSFPLLADYQKERVLVYLNVSQDPLGAGWNKLQSQIAVGSGGLFGKGYLKGTQNMLGFLPRTVAPTDFIYSVVAEETGFAGSTGLLVLYSLLVVRCMRAAVRAQELFGRLLAAGIGTLFFTHVFINIAMTVGLMPITGLPLPLMSYGGSFMVTTMTALGLVQSVYLRRRI
jgi:rod shape determining protein RodA